VTLHGFHTVVDGAYGPATARCVEGFQRKKRLRVDGVVNRTTFEALVAPLVRATREIDPGRRSLGRLVVAYARQHLREHPREVGGQNCGPWVRLYMDGNEGADWPWCAGFVSYLLEQACRTIGAPLPLETSFSCDWLASSAQQSGIFVTERQARSSTRITPGSVFLVRRTSTDWTHTGIVLRPEGDVFHTIEGNTNDDGHREGYEVCQRVRSFSDKDFILI
jgi:hypothetical protein